MQIYVYCKKGDILMSYTGISNQKNIHIDNIYSVHYFEYTNTFSFKGESHDFWELVYVDTGKINIVAGSESLSLKSNEIFFHEPNEFHSVKVDESTAPNVIIISFSCKSEMMCFLKHKKFTLNQREHNILGRIIAEARQCFSCRLDDPYLKTLPLNSEAPFGSIELIFNYLEQFLIIMLRKHSAKSDSQPRTLNSKIKVTKRMSDAKLFNEIVKNIQDNLYENISVANICETYSLSRSTLQRLFKRHCNLSITEYISYLRIERAKEMIRLQNLNFTQIAAALGYSSVHYFSRQFKQISGMNPSEYATSIKAILEADD
jgi:AraC-like DNA-binding protein